MKTKIIIILILTFQCVRICAQSPIDWSINLESDGHAYIILPYRDSILFFSSVDSTRDNHYQCYGEYSVVLRGVSYTGQSSYLNCYGGSNFDRIIRIQTINDELIGVGASRSDDYDLNGCIIPVDSSNVNIENGWHMVLDSNFNMISSHCLGGSNDDFIPYIDVSPMEDYYVIAMNSNSNDYYCACNKGNRDIVLIAFNSQHDTLWTKCYGSSGNDSPFQVIIDRSGRVVVLGRSDVPGDGDVPLDHTPGSNFWLFTIDTLGNIVHNQLLNDYPFFLNAKIIQSKDNGYYIIGDAFNSTDPRYHGKRDVYVLKLDQDFNFQWDQYFGGSEHDFPSSSIFEDGYTGNLVVVANTFSNDGDVSNNRGDLDILVLFIAPNGNLIDKYVIGGTQREESYGAYYDAARYKVMLGVLSRSSDFDFPVFYGNQMDFWLMQLSPPWALSSIEDDHLNKAFRLYPNPTQGCFSIHSDEIDLIDFIQLYNNQGMAIGSQIRSDDYRHISIEEPVVTGIYWVQFHTRKGVFSLPLHFLVE